MKAFPTLTSSLALSALLLTAQAQTPATSAKPTPTTTGKRIPEVVGSKNIGQKMVEKSKPTDMNVPLPPRRVKK